MSRVIEVELKARVDDLAAVESLLPVGARLLEEVDYTDTYYTFPGTEGFSFHRFRLRESGGKSVVTVKEKKLGQEKMAVSEYEFEVSDAEAFREFTRIFGCRIMLTKRKRGKRYLLPDKEPGIFLRGPVVELVEIEGLGQFVEIEILVAEGSQVQAAQARLREVLRELKLPESAVEPRPYTKMLYEKAGAKEQ